MTKNRVDRMDQKVADDENNETENKRPDSFASSEDRQKKNQTYGKEDFDVKHHELEQEEEPTTEETEETLNQSETISAADMDLSPEEMAAKIDELVETVERLHSETAQARDGMLRKAAEFENLKKRTQKEKLTLFEDAKADAVSRFLPVREDLKRSMESLKDSEMEVNIRKGLELILKNFDTILKHYGVEAIEETGVPFDVNVHDAMLSQPVEDDQMAPNTVIQVLEPGYKLGDKIIKHARVIVSQ